MFKYNINYLTMMRNNRSQGRKSDRFILSMSSERDQKIDNYIIKDKEGKSYPINLS